MARLPDVEMLMRHVPEDGSSIGNIALREALGWDSEKYFRVRQKLIDNGDLEVGGGRGGSVYRSRTVGVRSKQLPSNPNSVISIFPLATVTLPDIDEAIHEAPQYGEVEFRALVRNTIGAIHQIPKLFYRKTGIKYHEAGRGVLRKVVVRQFCDCLKSRPAPSGRPRAARARIWHDLRQNSIQASLRYERHGIRLLEALRDMDGLCISNNSFAAVGRVGSVEPGFLYMTFRMLDEEPEAEAAHELTKDEIKEIVREYRNEIGAKSKEDAAAVDGFEVGLKAANDVNFHGDRKAKLIEYAE